MCEGVQCQSPNDHTHCQDEESNKEEQPKLKRNENTDGETAEDP